MAKKSIATGKIEELFDATFNRPDTPGEVQALLAYTLSTARLGDQIEAQQQTENARLAREQEHQAKVQLVSDALSAMSPKMKLTGRGLAAHIAKKTGLGVETVRKIINKISLNG